MLDTHGAERFLDGVLLSGLMTTVITLIILYLDETWRWSHHDSALMRLAVSAGVAGVMVFTRPLLHRTILRSRRNIFLDDNDLTQTLFGRAVGLLGGLVLAIGMGADLFSY